MINPQLNRRAFLQQSACGFGSLALTQLLSDSLARGSESEQPNVLAQKPTHFKPTARRIIFLYMKGGPSQMDLF
ncbi:MAG: sulfatase, partial [Planctomycetaceae bacterium]|nr:sulfatase [Planctomycetaceae bacterium]